jgi:hypothetical protein
LIIFASESRALPNATVRRGEVAPFQGVRGALKGIAIRGLPAFLPTVVRPMLTSEAAVSRRSRAKRADLWGSRASP